MAVGVLGPGRVSGTPRGQGFWFLGRNVCGHWGGKPDIRILRAVGRARENLSDSRSPEAGSLTYSRWV